MGEYANTDGSKNYGRRKYDMDCQLHADQLNDMQKSVEKNSGKYASMMWFLGMLGLLIGGLLAVLVEKTSDIQTLVTDSKVMLAQHAEQIANTQREVEELRVRLNYYQRGIIK